MAIKYELEELLWRVQVATGPCRYLDNIIASVLAPDLLSNGPKSLGSFWSFTSSIDAAVALVNRVLPGWWWKLGTCHVSDDACLAPDYSDPVHGARLKREFPLPSERHEETNDRGSTSLTFGPFDDGFDIDRRPPGNLSLALLEALLIALIYIEERQQ